MITWDDNERMAVEASRRASAPSNQLNALVERHHSGVVEASKKMAQLLSEDLELSSVYRGLERSSRERTASAEWRPRLLKLSGMVDRLASRLVRHEDKFTSSEKAATFWKNSYAVVQDYREGLSDLVSLSRQASIREAQNLIVDAVAPLSVEASSLMDEEVRLATEAYDGLDLCDRAFEAARKKKKQRKKTPKNKLKKPAPIESDPWNGKKKTFDSAFRKVEHAHTQLERILAKMGTDGLMYGDVRYARDMLQKVLAAMRRA